MYRQAALFAALTVGAASALPAQGWVELETTRRPGMAMGPVVRVSSNVRTTIDGRVARVEVEELFRNTGPRIAEGSYLYPLPKNAVFSDFSLWMGDQEIKGEIMNAGEARKIYENIVRRLKDPALLSLEGHGLIRARVFPIQAGETRRVKLRYTQVLERAGDAMRLRYNIGPRRHGPDRGLGGGTEPTFRDNFSYRVTVPNADDIGTPYSPTHPIETERLNGRLVVTLSPDATGDVDPVFPGRPPEGPRAGTAFAHANLLVSSQGSSKRAEAFAIVRAQVPAALLTPPDPSVSEIWPPALRPAARPR